MLGHNTLAYGSSLAKVAAKLKSAQNCINLAQKQCAFLKILAVLHYQSQFWDGFRKSTTSVLFIDFVVKNITGCR